MGELAAEQPFITGGVVCKSCALPEGYSLYIPAGYRLTEAAFSGAGQVYAYHTAGEGISTKKGYVLCGEEATYGSSARDSVFVYGDVSGYVLAEGPSGLGYAAGFEAFTTYAASGLPSFALSGAALSGRLAFGFPACTARVRTGFKPFNLSH